MKRVPAMASLFLLTVAGLTSCGKEGEVVTVEKLKTCPAEYENRVVTVESYLSISRRRGRLFCMGGGCDLKLSSEPGGESLLVAAVPFGSGPNQMEKLPPEFMFTEMMLVDNRPLDDGELGRFYDHLRVYDAGGKPVRPREKVRVTGKLEMTLRGELCTLHEGRIEQP